MLNKSKSKQKYSFTKADRFPTTKQINLNHTHLSDSNYTNLSRSASQNLTTFGLSEREVFRSSVYSPSAKYSIKSTFDINLANKKGNALSCSRSSLDNSNFSYMKKNYNPGPGQYEPDKIKSKKKIVIGTKLRNPCKEAFLNDKAINNGPAPNKYEIKKQTPKNGKFTSLSIRFNEERGQKPGPGAYEIKGNYEKNKFMNSSTTSFSKQSRKNFFDKENRNPGPGTYKLYSQFD